jgi:hypothetical protein
MEQSEEVVKQQENEQFILSEEIDQIPLQTFTNEIKIPEIGINSDSLQNIKKEKEITSKKEDSIFSELKVREKYSISDEFSFISPSNYHIKDPGEEKYLKSENHTYLINYISSMMSPRISSKSNHFFLIISHDQTLADKFYKQLCDIDEFFIDNCEIVIYNKMKTLGSQLARYSYSKISFFLMDASEFSTLPEFWKQGIEVQDESFNYQGAFNQALATGWVWVMICNEISPLDPQQLVISKYQIPDPKHDEKIFSFDQKFNQAQTNKIYDLVSLVKKKHSK